MKTAELPDDMIEDSTGKCKISDAQNRTRALTTAFVIGLTIGVVVSERLYLATNTPAGQVSSEVHGSHAVAARKALPTKKQEAGEDMGATKAELEKYLKKVAPNKEVLMAISNRTPLMEGMLLTFISGITRAGVKNYVVVALDRETEAGLRARDMNVIYMHVPVPKAQAETGSNHALSSLKFGIIKRFLELGWAVLLSDVDVCVLKDPFKHLYRDSDVEGMSDGFDPPTAYGAIDGFDDASMGWSRYAQLYKHFNLNSGLFYVRPSPRTVDMMGRLEERLAREKYWDQTAYNEVMFGLSHGAYKSPQVSVRVMDIYVFMNSKILFKDVRKRAPQDRPAMPAMVHINYHPNKHERMQAVFKYYLDKDARALDPFPGGSEPGS